MHAIVAAAHEMDYAVLFLETGPRQPAARSLYEALRWQRVEDFPPGAHVHAEGTRFQLVLAPEPRP